MSEQDYIDYNNAMRIIEGKKDSNGDTINGSLKQGRYNKLISMGMNHSKAVAYLEKRYGYKY